MQRIKAAHVVWRITGPALTADVVVEVRVAVSDNIKAGDFLIAQIAAYRVFILLAEAPAHHGFEKMPSAEILRVPARPRQRTGNGRRQHDVLGATKHGERLPRFS